MIYRRPQIEKRSKKGPTFTVTESVDYKIADYKSGYTFPKKILVTQNFTEVAQDGYIYGKSVGKIPPEIISMIVEYSDLISKGCQVAEALNQKLLKLLIKYDSNGSKDELIICDFMNLRDRLSDIVKEDSRFHDIERLRTSGSRKTFRKLFAEFIEDRNIYTHGEMLYRINDKVILMRFINKKERNFSICIITKDIVYSFFSLYEYLNSILKDMEKKINGMNTK